MSTTKVLIAAGGTGGHVYPAIAIADALRETSDAVEILFVGTKNPLE
jgi:UDP-N-acetylglucosamine--N-acetylmuramyl-(pentapeptide) pyrophosphoryl-undecaprenol N-acetylglucosamine transferase